MVTHDYLSEMVTHQRRLSHVRLRSQQVGEELGAGLGFRLGFGEVRVGGGPGCKGPQGQEGLGWRGAVGRCYRSFVGQPNPSFCVSDARHSRKLSTPSN